MIDAPPGQPADYAKPPVSVSDLVDYAAALLGVPAAKLIGANRHTDLVRGRWAIMIALSERGMPLLRIGRALGKRDHTTVINGLRRGRALAAVDQDFARLLAAVQELAEA